MDLLQLTAKIKEHFPEAIASEEKVFLVIKREWLLKVADFLKNSDLAFSNMHCITAVDRKDKMEVVYFVYSFELHTMLEFKVVLPMDDLTIETVSHLWHSANWLERETYDFFGIKFLHHPDLRRIMNPDEWTDHPLRKDFDRPDFFRLPQSDGLKAG